MPVERDPSMTSNLTSRWPKFQFEGAGVAMSVHRADQRLWKVGQPLNHLGLQGGFGEAFAGSEH